MTALTANKGTDQIDGTKRHHLVGASVHIFKGAAVVVNAAGFLIPATGGVATHGEGGRAMQEADNSSGSNGDLSCQFQKGIFVYANTTSTGEILGVHTNSGTVCYWGDDATVTITAGSNSVAGKIIDVEGDGLAGTEGRVWVDQR